MRQFGEIVQITQLALSIGLLTRNDSSHAALRGGNITDIAGNQVEMNMKNALSRRLADIHADVVTVGMETLIDQRFDTV